MTYEMSSEPMVSFCRCELRTTDATAARSFYDKVLGHDRVVIWQLHEQALARGARPHWLGQLSVEDPEGVAAAFVARGATRLGPSRAVAGVQGVVLRDPGGALVCVAPPQAADEPESPVVWHVLNTADAATAEENYRALFGWAFGARVDLGEHGVFRLFAWSAGGPSVGALGDIAGRPGVHPHWLHFFEVDSLDRAVAEVRGLGGVAVAMHTLPSGARVWVCDDPQGAAFALRER